MVVGPGCPRAYYETEAMIRVTALRNLRVGQVSEVLAGNRYLCLLHVRENEVAAFSHLCPHRGGPLKYGSLDDCILTCAWHGWRFDLRSGCRVDMPEPGLQLFPVRIHAGEVFVKLPE